MIKLTLLGTDIPIYINVAFIISIATSLEKGNTVITILGRKYELFVNESVEYIISKMDEIL